MLTKSSGAHLLILSQRESHAVSAQPLAVNEGFIQIKITRYVKDGDIILLRYKFVILYMDFFSWVPVSPCDQMGSLQCYPIPDMSGAN